MKRSILLTVLLILASSSLCLAKVVHQYYPNGKILSTQIYNDNGSINGPYKTYWPNGKLKSDTVYKHGRPTITRMWSEKGVLIKRHN